MTNKKQFLRVTALKVGSYYKFNGLNQGLVMDMICAAAVLYLV
jgi:hypothetical protein